MTFAERVTAWAEEEPSVSGVVLIGSQTRAATDDIWRADAQSDWDFQIITSRPELFETSDWAKTLGYPLLTYVVRRAAIGGVPKVAALFAGAEADFVILPAEILEGLRRSVTVGAHVESPELRGKLQDLAIVVRPGWRFLKGAEKWEPFFQQVVRDVADPRVSDDAVRNLADGFVCDAVWTRRKIDRGEFLAAQRMLHRALVETNIRLLHELKLRQGERSFPEARRAERILSSSDLRLITVSAVPDGPSLRAALEKASESCRQLTRALVGDTWRWPAV